MESNKSMIYFTSDTHFGHKNILKPEYSDRPWQAIEDHDKNLIEIWNNTVGPEDDIFHLGDFGFLKPRQIKEILRQLNGRIHLIYGNHDKLIMKRPDLQTLFASVQHYSELKVPDEEMDVDQTIVMFHYPIESWNKRHHGAWHLHGHCHGTLKSTREQARMDVGVDVWDYTPISYDQVKAHMTSKVMHSEPVDHHGVR